MNEINEKYGEINELKLYLHSTDYMIIKSYETDYIVPEEVLKLRQEARDRINVLEDEIEKIKSQEYITE